MSSHSPPSNLYAPAFADEWDRYSLYELAQWINGLAFKTSDFARAGIPVVKIAEVKNGTTGQTKFTTNTYDPKYLLHDGDMLFCWSGQPETSIDAFWWNGGEGWLNQHIFKVVPDASVVEDDYFYYLLRYLRPTFVQIARDKQTTGLGHVTKRDLQNLVVAVPDRDYQGVLAASVRAFDEKINSNLRTMQMLDQLFHALWRQLYDSLDESRLIPLSEVVSTQYGLTASADPSLDGLKFLRVMDINKQNWIEWGNVPGVIITDADRSKYLLNPGDLVVARMADPGKSALYDDLGVPAVFASYLVRLTPGSVDEGLFLFGFLKSAEYVEYAEGVTTGSVQKNMNARVIVNVSLRWPTDELIKRFAEDVKPLRTQLNRLVHENARLEELRDTVLPGLMTGELRTPQHDGAIPVGVTS